MSSLRVRDWLLVPLLFVALPCSAQTLQVAVPNFPEVPTRAACELFSSRAQQAVESANNHLDACLRSDRGQEAFVIEGCWEYGTRRCFNMARDVCRLRKDLDNQAQQCSLAADRLEFAQRSARGPDAFDLSPDSAAAGVVVDQFRQVPQPGQPANAISQHMGDAAAITGRQTAGTGMSDLNNAISSPPVRPPSAATGAARSARRTTPTECANEMATCRVECRAGLADVAGLSGGAAAVAAQMCDDTCRDAYSQCLRSNGW